MFYFPKRSEAREFAKRQEHYTPVDCGSDKPIGKRWAVKVF